MREIVERLTENRRVELAKSILESNGYKVSKKINENDNNEIKITDDWPYVKFIPELEVGQVYDIEDLVYHKNEAVRLSLAKQGYALDKLIDDEDFMVREEVARQGYRLDVLINDRDWRVRRAVARQGYRLDVLINDKDGNVRRAVALQGYGLDVLIHDKEDFVRGAVAQQGYGINRLIDDVATVAAEAMDYLEKHGYKLGGDRSKAVEEWSRDNPDKVVSVDNPKKRKRYKRKNVS